MIIIPAESICELALPLTLAKRGDEIVVDGEGSIIEGPAGLAFSSASNRLAIIISRDGNPSPYSIFSNMHKWQTAPKTLTHILEINEVGQVSTGNGFLTETPARLVRMSGKHLLLALYGPQRYSATGNAMLLDIKTGNMVRYLDLGVFLADMDISESSILSVYCEESIRSAGDPLAAIFSHEGQCRWQLADQHGRFYSGEGGCLLPDGRVALLLQAARNRVLALCDPARDTFEEIPLTPPLTNIMAHLCVSSDGRYLVGTTHLGRLLEGANRSVPHIVLFDLSTKKYATFRVINPIAVYDAVIRNGEIMIADFLKARIVRIEIKTLLAANEFRS